MHLCNDFLVLIVKNLLNSKDISCIRSEHWYFILFYINFCNKQFQKPKGRMQLETNSDSLFGIIIVD